MRLGFISTVNLREMYVCTPANPGEIVVFSHVKCAGVVRMHSLVDFSNGHSVVMRVGYYKMTRDVSAQLH